MWNAFPLNGIKYVYTCIYSDICTNISSKSIIWVSFLFKNWVWVLVVFLFLKTRTIKGKMTPEANMVDYFFQKFLVYAAYEGKKWHVKKSQCNERALTIVDFVTLVNADPEFDTANWQRSTAIRSNYVW